MFVSDKPQKSYKSKEYEDTKGVIQNMYIEEQTTRWPK
jgi:hypothetical protein